MEYSQNARLVLQCLRRHGELSRAEISRMTGLSAQTASVLMNKLLKDELVVETHKRYGSIGKPATQIQLNPQGAYSLGIKLGRKDIIIVLVDFTGVVIDRVFLQQDLPQPEAEMELILQQSNQLFSNNPGSALRLAGIGVAAPFRLEAWHNELGLDQETSDRLAAWAGFDVVDALEQSFGCDVFMENDGTAAAIAEMLFGVGKRVNNFVYLFLDVVIGGGVVCDGDILRGTNSNAGDLALMRIGSPGQSSLLLEHASLFLLLNKLSKAGIEKPKITQLSEDSSEQRQIFDQWVEQAAQALPWLLSISTVCWILKPWYSLVGCLVNSCSILFNGWRSYWNKSTNWIRVRIFLSCWREKIGVMFMHSVQPWSPTTIDMRLLLQFCRGKLSKY